MRVLVAEDHVSLARSLANGLREEGFAVDVTSDGTEALHFGTTTPYDCIILDVMLPGMDGWEIVKKLREAKFDSPVLFLTAKDATDDRVKGLNLGADDYLVKPFVWEELLARVRALMRRKYSTRSPVLQIADLVIDTTRRAVSRGGEPIKLSAREFSLLSYLAARQGEVVSRRDMWTHLYDDADEGTSNVIDVYIAYLRAKIDKGRTPKLIHTRHGAGYILTAET